jgi:hypothetical protein
MLRVMRDPTRSDQSRDETARAAAPQLHAKLVAEKMEPKRAPERSAAEIKADSAEAHRLGVKFAPLDPQTIEGEAAEVTNGVARIGVKTLGLMAEFERVRRSSGLARILEETNRATGQWAFGNRGVVESIVRFRGQTGRAKEPGSRGQ